MTTICNTDDIIDSRDIIDRIEELEDLCANNDGEELAPDENGEVEYDGVNLTSEYEELITLREVAKQGEQVADDWEHGEAMIHEDYFTEYAEELADDIGAIDANASWPLCCIDWDAAAEQLKVDYDEIDFDGHTYYIR